MKPTLLMTGTNNQVSLWRPLSESYTLAFADHGMAMTAKNLDIDPVLSLQDFSGDEEVGQVRSRAMLMAADIVDAAFKGSLVLDPEVPALHGMGLASWLPGFAHDTLAPTMARISACSKLHEKHPVIGVLVHEDVTMMGRTIAMWGNAKGLPTMHIPHANHFSRPGTSDVHCQLTAQYQGVLGTYMERWYQACGAENTEKIGAPWWDKLYDQDRLPTKEHARRAFGIKGNRPVLGYATTWYQMTTMWGDSPEEFLEEALHTVLRASRRMGAFLILKMHPGEAPGQEQHYADEMRKYGVEGAVTRDYPEHSIIASDCFITQGPSNFGVESSILGTPVVEMYVPGARYPEYGPKGTWGEQLCERIWAAQVEEAFVEAMNHRNDGKATDRAMEWIRGICEIQES